MKLRFATLALLACFLNMSCTNDDLQDEHSISKALIGNTYAHLNFETREECEAAQELHFMNCAQGLEIINEAEVEIYLTDIVYKNPFYIEDNELIVEATPDTFEFSEDLRFTILENGDLQLGNDRWIQYEVDFYE